MGWPNAFTAVQEGLIPMKALVKREELSVFCGTPKSAPSTSVKEILQELFLPMKSELYTLPGMLRKSASNISSPALSSKS